MKDEKYKILKVKQTWIQIAISNMFTMTFIALCAWASKDSTWWTFVTGCIFLFWMSVRIASIYKESMNEFNTKQELLDWANSLPDDL